MKYLRRQVTARCAFCGQNLTSKQTTAERTSELNDRASRLAKSLGRWPQMQTCEKCHKIIFEGESGFRQRFLLVDMA